MALSGSFSGSAVSGHYTVRVDWTAAQNVSANTSTITAKIYFVIDKNWSLSMKARSTNKLTINGVEYAFSSPAINSSGGTTTHIATVTSSPVSHNSDGTKTVAMSVFFDFKATINSTYYASITGSGSFVLNQIYRSATLSTATNFSDGVNPTIIYSNPAGTAVTSLQAGIYDSTGYTAYVAYREISKTGTSYTFPLTTAEWNTLKGAIQEGNSVSVKFYIKTTIGGNTYLSTPLTRTFSVSNASPVITASVVDTNPTTIALTGDSRKLIKYYSNAQATMSAEAQHGAAIDESLYIIRNGNNSGYGTTHTFNNVESNVFTFSAEDNRGNVGTASVTSTMVNYIKLTCNIANNRPNALGNMTVACSGNFFNGSFGAASNTLTVQYRYAISVSALTDNWSNMTVTKNGNTYYAYADFDIPNFDQQQSYAFETRAIDALDTVTSTESSVKSKPVFHWGENDFVFEVPVTFNAGTSGVSPEGDAVDCTLGTWTPALSSNAVSSYTMRRGWYMKMGQVVTVGFFIKATCNSGYNSTSISISGLPFIPLYSAAGGGMCSGAYVSAGFNFQCFVAETTASITTRVQACNNTSATNLSTSSSGCFYRSSGGELTLSGTITFMANS